MHAVARSDFGDREFVGHFAILKTPCGAPYVLALGDLVLVLSGVTCRIVDGWRGESKSYLGLDAGLLGEDTPAGPAPPSLWLRTMVSGYAAGFAVVGIGARVLNGSAVRMLE